MRKFTAVIMICIVLLSLVACKGAEHDFEHALFSCTLPEGWAKTADEGVLCFAPNGDALMSSSISFSATEKNWYFDDFTQEDYSEQLKGLGYESVELVSFEKVKVDGFPAVRAAFRVRLEQGEHLLVLYAVDSDMSCFFVLLNREGDDYEQAFDDMMKNIDIKRTK